jgi:hypothetical protein
MGTPSYISPFVLINGVGCAAFDLGFRKDVVQAHKHIEEAARADGEVDFKLENSKRLVEAAEEFNKPTLKFDLLEFLSLADIFLPFLWTHFKSDGKNARKVDVHDSCAKMHRSFRQALRPDDAHVKLLIAFKGTKSDDQVHRSWRASVFIMGSDAFWRFDRRQSTWPDRKSVV